MTGGVDVSINLIWLLFGGVIIFIMQAGFGMLEAGSVRYKNHMNSLLKNALIPCVGGIVWVLFGFGFGLICFNNHYFYHMRPESFIILFGAWLSIRSQCLMIIVV